MSAGWFVTEELSLAGTPVASRRGQWGWAFFDWANQPFFTLIITFMFGPYFAAKVVGDATQGQELWGYTQAIAGLLIAVFGPICGAIADESGPRKPWIFFFQAVCILACAGLWLALPGADQGQIVAIMAVLVIATLGAEFSIVFNNAMLPSLTSESKIGRLSGNAWALGYTGGLVALIVVQLAFVLPDEPFLGLDKSAHEHDRIVGPLSALWMLVFIIPLALFTPDAKPSGKAKAEAVRLGLKELWRTLGQVMHYRNVARFLLARMLYTDGLNGIFAFGGIYAVGIFAWDITTLGLFGIILTIMAAIGAFIGGWLDDRIGSKKTIILAVTGLLIATLGVISISTEDLGDGRRQDTVLYIFTLISEPTADGGPFQTQAEWVFMVFGILIGICGGPAQAASRTLLSRLSPPELIGKFFGLYALSGKATAFMAPFTVAVLTGLFNSQRAGMVAIVVFLLAGLLLFLPVREERTEPA